MIKPWRSLKAQAFYLIALLIVIAVAMNSWQNIRTFKTHLDRQFERETIEKSSAIAGQVVPFFQAREIRLNLLLQQTVGKSQDLRLTQLKQHLSADSHLVAIEVFQVESSAKSYAYANHSGNHPEFYEDQDPQKTIGQFRLLSARSVEQAHRNQQNFVIDSLFPETGLPALIFGKRFKTRGIEGEYWLVETMWLNPINQILGKQLTAR